LALWTIAFWLLSTPALPEPSKLGKIEKRLALI